MRAHSKRKSACWSQETKSDHNTDMLWHLGPVLRIRIRAFFAESEIFLPDSDSGPDSDLDPVPDPVI
jgi:hypothetical protein